MELTLTLCYMVHYFVGIWLLSHIRREPRCRTSMKCLLPLLLISIGTLSAVGDFSQSLFVLERSTNANVIHYDAKITSDGTTDPKEPVIAYWVMSAEE